MINLELAKSKFWDNAAEGYIFFLKENLEPAHPQATLDLVEKELFPHLKEIFKKQQFEGKKGQACSLPAMRNGQLVQLIFIGLGKLAGAWHLELECFRRALATSITIIKKYSLVSVVLPLPDVKPFNISEAELAKQCAIVALMADYQFDVYKTDKKNPVACKLLVAPQGDATALTTPLTQGTIVGMGINNARLWADTPANIMTPTALSNEAKKIADKHNLKCTIFGRDKALELGMGAFCSVDKGSDQDGKFVVIEYKNDAAKTTLALCGKGIIFDTGGLNLKPSTGMYSMKYDMCGAASVITMMDIIAQLKPTINVIGLTPLVENMPSGNASHPSDIVTCMNGKTVEIRDTDAEGRLVLSDTLCYAEKFYSPDIIIDIATLTGAVQHALGHFYSGLMTKDDAIAQQLINMGQLTGDRIWQLPLDDDFKEAIKSDVADIHNSSSPAYWGGTITGAIFLQNFVQKARWAHIDIGGSAHDVAGINYVGKGASGASIRAVIEFIMNFKG